MRLPPLVLASSCFNGDEEIMGFGAKPDSSLTETFGLTSQHESSKGWDYIEAESALETTLYFVVQKEAFVDDGAYERFDLSEYFLKIDYYEPLIEYRFWLG